MTNTQNQSGQRPASDQQVKSGQQNFKNDNKGSPNSTSSGSKSSSGSSNADR